MEFIFRIVLELILHLVLAGVFLLCRLISPRLALSLINAFVALFIAGLSWLGNELYLGLQTVDTPTGYWIGIGIIIIINLILLYYFCKVVFLLMTKSTQELDEYLDKLERDL